MDQLQIGLLLDRQASTATIHSARPDAPTFAPIDRAPRTRTVLALALRRVADAVAPAQPATRSARRRVTCTGAEAH